MERTEDVKTILPNTHVSAETAYVVADYPYGFNLRCSIRYWLEGKRNFGLRLVSQTTNPKRDNVWNKPKAGGYVKFAAAMYLDSKGHLQWSGLSEYTNFAESKAWIEQFADGVPQDWHSTMYAWLNAKLVYETRRDHEKRFAGIQEQAVALGVVLKVARGKFKVTRNPEEPEVFVLCEDIDHLESYLDKLAA